MSCAPSPAEVVACELKAIRADSEEHDCVGSPAASRAIVAAATRLIGEAKIYARSDASRLSPAGAQNFDRVRNQSREDRRSAETSSELQGNRGTQIPDSFQIWPAVTAQLNALVA